MAKMKPKSKSSSSTAPRASIICKGSSLHGLAKSASVIASNKNKQNSNHPDEKRNPRPRMGTHHTCSGCMKAIRRDKFLLKACDKYWHEGCLRCDRCHGKLAELGSSLYCKSNSFLCRQDYLDLYGQTGRCSVCDKTILAHALVMRAKHNVYHLECFACQFCNLRFCVGDQFYLYENKIICQFDYEEHILPMEKSLAMDIQANYSDQRVVLSIDTNEIANNNAIIATSNNKPNGDSLLMPIGQHVSVRDEDLAIESSSLTCLDSKCSPNSTNLHNHRSMNDESHDKNDDYEDSVDDDDDDDDDDEREADDEDDECDDDDDHDEASRSIKAVDDNDGDDDHQTNKIAITNSHEANRFDEN